MTRRIDGGRIAGVALRVALALGFLSAVADRFGLWGGPGSPNVAWGDFGAFLEYTGLLIGFLPDSLVPVLSWMATVLEVVLALGLLSGFYLRWFAFGSGLLLGSFAVCMTVSLGFEPAFSYSVWTAGAAAFYLGLTGAPKAVAA